MMASWYDKLSLSVCLDGFIWGSPTPVFDHSLHVAWIRVIRACPTCYVTCLRLGAACVAHFLLMKYLYIYAQILALHSYSLEFLSSWFWVQRSDNTHCTRDGLNARYGCVWKCGAPRPPGWICVNCWAMLIYVGCIYGWRALWLNQQT